MTPEQKMFSFISRRSLFGLVRLMENHILCANAIEEDMTALHAAVLSESPEITYYLLTKGADPDIECANQTALEFAKDCHCLAIVDILRRFNKNPETIDKKIVKKVTDIIEQMKPKQKKGNRRKKSIGNSLERRIQDGLTKQDIEQMFNSIKKG